MSTNNYTSAKEFAKEVRQLLRDQFPDLDTYHFSVTTSRSSSLTIAWEGLPTKESVQSAVPSSPSRTRQDGCQVSGDIYRTADGSLRTYQDEEQAPNGAEALNIVLNHIFFERSWRVEPLKRSLEIMRRGESGDNLRYGHSLDSDQQSARQIEVYEGAAGPNLRYEDNEQLKELFNLHSPPYRSKAMGKIKKVADKNIDTCYDADGPIAPTVAL